jgi:plastocyanin
MKKATSNTITVILGVLISISTSTLIAFGLGLDLQVYAQNGNEDSQTETEDGNEDSQTETGIDVNATDSVAEELSATPVEKIFRIFTSEIEHVEENKLGVAGDVYSLNTIVVEKGDKVTVNFYNVDDVQTEKHSFTMDNYGVNIDLAFGENGNAMFTADQTGVFTYYCHYHLPVMTGQLVVLP